MQPLFNHYFEPLAAVGAGPDGRNCLAYTAEEDLAHERFCAQLRALGVVPQQDAWGNSYGTWVGTGDEGCGPLIAIGSHLDGVPNGGRYDGVLGVAAALVVLHRLQQQGWPGRLRVIAWRGEESARFRSSCLGSKGASGLLTEPMAAQRLDAQGVSLRQAVQGCRGQAPSPVAAGMALLELHIEQGPLLARLGRQQQRPVVGVVSAIAGSRRQRWQLPNIGVARLAALLLAVHERVATLDSPEQPLRVTFTPVQGAPNVGRDHTLLRCRDPQQAALLAAVGSGTVCGPNVRFQGPHTFHSGGQPMNQREGVDQIIVAARAVVASSLNEGLQWPDFQVQAGFHLQLDLRAGDAARMTEALAQMLPLVQGVGGQVVELGETPADALSSSWAMQMQEVAQRLGIAVLPMVSGAGHDVQVPPLSHKGLLFIASQAQGVSHHHSEAVQMDEVVAGLRLLEAVVVAHAAQGGA
ncbi:peptidase M20 [Magnetococcus marinus MC-1]|uniref:Peptidase M20 n=1 Tax=Magnetococcus marinus (strain ATCC BAA-1437 / JCM 17883 / MC-1) TaxID=156889 RepID=A0L6K9_MAGMM|nr:M20/M25/M40 family metallo-hydrolase [Magnetococcus marinus]ABK43602.1 peptidase M20 [Magnetococcus marinus MC-1]